MGAEGSLAREALHLAFVGKKTNKLLSRRSIRASGAWKWGQREETLGTFVVGTPERQEGWKSIWGCGQRPWRPASSVSSGLTELLGSSELDSGAG